MKRHNITKKDLKNEIHFNLGIPDSLSEKILNSVFEIIVEGLLRDGEVKISNFGKFKILDKNARIGRNPKTKQEFNITKRKVVTFYPSLSIKKKFNEKKEQNRI
tara:strand:+ start:968 stop:1279 length:312 start_codon:yes stop_codon:yes gene_type:complete